MNKKFAHRNGLLYMVILTKEQLEKKNIRNLQFIDKQLKRFLGCIGGTYGRRCCNLCNEYIGDDWENDVGVHLSAYQEYQRTLWAVMTAKETAHRITHPLLQMMNSLKPGKYKQVKA